MPMQNWIINKIATYLMGKEGCQVTDVKATANGTEVTIQDIFGYRYSIEVKLMARINDNVEGMEVYGNTKESSSFVTAQKLK